MTDFDTYVNLLREISEDIKSGNHDNDEKHIQTLKTINKDLIETTNDFLNMSDDERLVIHRLMNYICSLISDTRSKLIMELGIYCAIKGLYSEALVTESSDQEDIND